jgi:DNA mismatch repair protein MutS
MMEQWVNAKAQHPDAILLFRMGDFYELFDQDAVIAAPILELALTSRDKDKNGVKMAGFPFHAAESYIAKLIEIGHKVALCEQLEDPKASKGIVKRGITQVLTPGTMLDSEESLHAETSYLISIITCNKHTALAALDITTASFLVTSSTDSQKMLDEVIRLKPKEIVVLKDDVHAINLSDQAAVILGRLGNVRVEKKHGFDYLGDHDPSTQAIDLIKSYVRELKGVMPAHVGLPTRYSIEQQVLMDEATRINLDLVPKKKGHRFNLVSILMQECKTAMGRRAIMRAVLAPSTNLDLISHRHDLIDELNDQFLRLELKNYLRSVGDLEKLTALAASQKISPRGLGRLRDALIAIRKLLQIIYEKAGPKSNNLAQLCPDLTQLEEQLSKALVEQPSLSVKDGAIFNKNYDASLDQLHELATNGQNLMLALEARERELTGINSLKIKYTRVFGYYIEVTRTNLDRVPAHYQRKQTIANGERYFTAELAELELKLNSAQEQLACREVELFEQLRALVLSYCSPLLELARYVAELDMLVAFADIAYLRRWVRPDMRDASELIININEGRHPIVEELCLADGAYFVPNSINLNNNNNLLALITGPNMGGKSTIMRQVALIQILAQIGSFVPARSAILSICDSIFARVGASDDLGSGRSTFMVEMTETSYILQHATPRSLLLLDEIGRGTSTYDGLSIAQAVAEYIHDNLKSRTLFATHYHELTKLEKSLAKLKNFHVEVEENDSGVRFLYTLKAGPAQKSFGIQVAKLAGLPESVVKRAGEVLAGLEAQPEKSSKTAQPDLFGLNTQDPKTRGISEQLTQLDINRITPLQAINKLQAWQNTLKASLRS